MLLSGDYTYKWNTGQPANTGHCAVMWAKKGYKLETKACNGKAKYNFVCQVYGLGEFTYGNLRPSKID